MEVAVPPGFETTNVVVINELPIHNLDDTRAIPVGRFQVVLVLLDNKLIGRTIQFVTRLRY
jgi:hypothetical protein